MKNKGPKTKTNNFKNENFEKRKVVISCARRAQQKTLKTISTQIHIFQNNQTFLNLEILLEPMSLRCHKDVVKFFANWDRMEFHKRDHPFDLPDCEKLFIRMFQLNKEMVQEIINLVEEHAPQPLI